MFAAGLDGTKTTPRAAMHIVAPALKAVRVNVTGLTLSTSSIYGARKQMCKSVSDSIKETFQPHTPLVVHFDGKLLPDTDGKKSDRMPVVITGKDIEKLLSIPKL